MILNKIRVFFLFFKRYTFAVFLVLFLKYNGQVYERDKQLNRKHNKVKTSIQISD